MPYPLVEPTPHIAYCGGGYGRVSLLAADAVLADHARDCVQLLVNVHPECLAVRVDGVTQALKPFQATVIRARQTYAIPAQGVATSAAREVGFLLVKTDSSARSLDSDRDDAPSLHALSAPARDDAAHLVATLLREFPEAGAVERGVQALQSAMAPVLDCSRAPLRRTELHARIAREAESLCIQDLEEFPSIGGRAAAHGISERHFLTVFCQATQLAPRRFYNMRRLEAAFALLADASRSVAEIGYALGFSAPPHFTRFMRANTGWTPSAYRSRVQNLPPPLRPRWAWEPGVLG
jgi:AraC-like DNA-binding protein